MVSARRTALEILNRIEKEKSYSNILIEKTLDKTELSVLDASFVTALVMGTVENKITIDFYIKAFTQKETKKIQPVLLNILRLGIYQIIYLDRVPESAAVNESVKLASATGFNYAKGFVNAVLRQTIRSGPNLPLPDKNKDNLSYLEVFYSCPKALISLWINDYGAELTEGILSSLKQKPVYVARVNSLKTNTPELLQILEDENVTAKKTEITEEAIEFDKLPDLKNSPAFQKGLFHMQDYASQYCCGVLSPQPGETVLDICAAPGGKSFTAAQMMNNNGVITACDLYEARLKLIEEGAQRLGINIINTTACDAAEPNSKFEGADRVLCDVPCSGFGVIRRKPEIRYKNLTEVSKLPELQLKILNNAADYVKPGGTLVYSTCTLNKAENERVCEKFLSQRDDFGPKTLPNLWAQSEMSYNITLFPHIHHTDGFFIASFQKK